MRAAADLLVYLLYRAFVATVPLLPRRAAVWLGRRLGGLYALLSRRSRKVARENLRRVFPDRTDRERILRESFRLQGVALVDALWSSRLSAERARSYVEIPAEREREVREVVARRRGLVLATAHFGSWEMFNLAGGAMALGPGTFIARPVANRRIDAHLKRMRERTGNVLVYREGALLACVGALKRGEIVGTVIDMAVSPEDGGFFVDFFGTPALTTGAPAALAHRLRAPLGFAVLRPVDGGMRYRLESSWIEVDHDAPRKAELFRVTRELNARLEERIRAFPEGWIWGYKRWKYRPTELPGPYPSYAMWIHPYW